MHTIPDWFVLFLWSIHTPWHALCTLAALVLLGWALWRLLSAGWRRVRRMCKGAR